MASDIVKAALKQKYGKGISNVTSERISKKDINRRESDEVDLMKVIKRLRRSGDVPQRIINEKLEKLKKKIKKTEEMKDIVNKK